MDRAPAPPPLLVFAQPPEPRLDVPAWNAQAKRFFRTRLDLAEALTTGPLAPPWLVTATLLVARGDGPAQAVGLRARAATDADQALAAEIDAAAGAAGLALLARRCAFVWEIARAGAHDAAALRLAAVLASVLLGPVLDPSGRELFGVRTARAKLEAMGDGD